jgi:hypothetical protein
MNKHKPIFNNRIEEEEEDLYLIEEFKDLCESEY